MVTVDPISLSIGIAALFTTCIECFEYFKAATTLRKDFDILLLKLELEQERLLIWGENIGIGNKDGSEKLTFHGDTKRQDLARRCLKAIKNLLEDAENLKSMYGLQPAAATTGTVSHHGISSDALKRLRLRLIEKLIGNVRDLTDGLMRDAPGPRETYDEKVQNDIASLVDDIPRLRLFSEACEDVYPEWSDTAKSAIDASEIGTINGLLANDRLEQYQAVDGENAPGNARGTHDLPKWFEDGKGYWIAKDVEPQKFTFIDLEKHAETCRALQEHAIAQMKDELPTDDQFSVKLIDGVVSLIDYIKSEESKSFVPEYDNKKLEAIDRQWMEQIVYDYEEEVQITTPSPATQLSHIFRPHTKEKLCAAIIVLGEADYCLPLVESPPFPPFKPGRTPQETQLYRLTQDYSQETHRFWRRHYMGTYSRKAPPEKKRPAPVMLDTGAEGHESEPRSKRSLTSEPGQMGSQH
ncbi:hypothetical protein OEA41_000352 [Lepraria neglecta]|uniref:Prion-inhibition and propagation HeLo domain-containing protein n=1 Tax=Lepraria neglecta TaxID=209136 RepID=A0AAD9ZG33_9LECA|nr:hypothetical protein OEA41_000352 [Lepraria neglecta]